MGAPDRNLAGDRGVCEGDPALRSSLMLLPACWWLWAWGQLRPWPSASLTPSHPQEKERQRLENLRRKEEAEQLRRQKVEEDKRRRLEEVKL